MSEIAKPKLNLKALQKPSGAEVISETPTQGASIGEASGAGVISLESTTIPAIIPMTKISLGGIKKNAQKEKAPQTQSQEILSEQKTMIQEEKKNLGEDSVGTESKIISQNSSSNSPEMRVSDVPDKGGEHDSVVLSVSGENQEMTPGSEQEAEKEVKNTDPVQFQNYESGFKKQSGNVLKRIQNFRYTPKTRKGLVIGLISLCIGTIGFLMIFFPENHSVSIYKASILEIMNRNAFPENQNMTQNDTIPQKETTLPNQDTEEITSPPINEEVDENSQPSNTQDESTLRQEKKEILRQHLLKKYSSS